MDENERREEAYHLCKSAEKLQELMHDIRHKSNDAKPKFMCDDIVCYTVPRVRKTLLESESFHKIARVGPSIGVWPHNSADLNPLNFYLWGFIKSNFKNLFEKIMIL